MRSRAERELRVRAAPGRRRQTHDLTNLRFKCFDCQKTYCNDHRKTEAHDCTPVKNQALRLTRPVSKSVSPSPASTSSSKSASALRERTAYAANNRARTVSPPVATTIKTSTTANPPAALERLKALWAKKTSSSSTPAKPKKVNPLLALAELKRTAKGDEKIPTQDRVYFYLVRPVSEYTDPTTNKLSSRPEKKLAVYFRKDMIVGKALDKACELLAISNKNNTSSEHKIGLYNGTPQFIPYNQKLSENIKDGAVITVK